MRRMFMCFVCLLVLNCVGCGVNTIGLSGQWNFKLDRDNVGINEQWFSQQLPEKINLPGSLQEQSFGDKPSANTQWTSRIGTQLLSDPRFTEYVQSDDFKCPFWLTPDKHYVGKAWYQREVKIPKNWQNRRIVLLLERPHWKTTVWVDGQPAGSCDSLGAPHEYDLSNLLKPGGTHNLTICVDNDYVVPVGKDAHSISDQTQSNWNGITGKITLTTGSKIWIDDVQIFPDVTHKRIKVDIQLGNSTGESGKGVLKIAAKRIKGSGFGGQGSGARLPTDDPRSPNPDPVKHIPIEWDRKDTKVSYEYDMGDCSLWDEYSPALYNLTLSLKAKGIESVKQVQFGMRKLGIQDKQFTVNGRKIFLRGTLECCIFPQHGYPPTDVEEWKRIIRVAKSHGLNHFRFHSWCPPEAAFAAADQVGFYLQVEGSCWAGFGDGTALDKWIYEEIDRMIKAYGNHPSFCFFSPSNEPSGKNRDRFLAELLKSLKERDNRRFYVAGAGWPQIKENQYSIESAVRLQNYKTLRLNQPPQTFDDYHEHVNTRPVPVIGHEIGQWCAYPDLDEDKQYTGVLKAKNIEIFRDKLQKAGMGHLARQFLMASGKFQTLLYKQEIETALRTPGFAGFQLLDLHDFPGQGTAPVGVLNALWQSKGYCSPEQYRRFCNDVVPLARMKKLIFTGDSRFEAVIDVANYSAADLYNVELIWRITQSNKSLIKDGKFNVSSLPMGGLTRVGNIEYSLRGMQVPGRFNLEIELVGTPYANDWDFWVYPATLPSLGNSDIYIATGLDEQIEKKLDAGAKVLLLFPPSSVAGDTVGSFQPIFWNRITFPKNKVHTLGILCDPNHPALAKFPTDFHASWQWQDLLDNSQPIIMDKLPREITPILQPIDDWNNCRKLALLFEASVGTGKILVCSIDVQTDLQNRLTVRQLRHSLLAYMASGRFNPQAKLAFEQIKGLFKLAQVVQAESKTDSQVLRIKAAAKMPNILEGHLRMGTPDGPDGVSYGVNSLYFTRNGEPWLPVMGEIHYARVPHEYWEDSVLAMKAGGIEVIATYVFWIFHEEIQGQNNWQGDRDLRGFLEICQKHNMPVWIRIGPWCHGEARNGGFPDWLSKVCKPRSMDPAYFEQVQRWYSAVAEQIKGLYHKDGGPIIGIQFDNEFGHVGGTGDESYILKCKEIACRLGMDVPYYSVTGWGGAYVPKDEVLPVQGSYVDPFWAEGIDQLPPFKELLFSDLMSLVINTDVASDRVTSRIKQERLRYDPSRYPYATAELGGGMHHKWPRRPVLDPKDTEGMALCRLGEGANMIGYYMYHGGSQPLGVTGRLVEGGMPLVSYDFQAPLGEFGKTNDSYYHLKRLHQFIRDFGRELAPMVPSLPEERPEANDPSKLRYALRSKGKQGFLFFNNYQRYLDMPDRENVQFAVTLEDQKLLFPVEPITIPSKSLGLFPINVTVADAILVYATSQPLMRWQDGEVTRLVMVNLFGIETQLCLAGVNEPVVPEGQVRRDGDSWLIKPQGTGTLRLTTQSGAKVEILLISEQDSLNVWNIRIAGRCCMAICPTELWQDGKRLMLRDRRENGRVGFSPPLSDKETGGASPTLRLRIYPATDHVFTFNGKSITTQKEEGMSVYTLLGTPLPKVTVTSQTISELPASDQTYPFKSFDAPPKVWRIQVGDIDWDSISDVLVRFEYIGDTARLYLNGLLVADNFWCKRQWDVWLKRWKKELSEPDAEFILVISPWKKDQKVFVQRNPEVMEDLTAELFGVKAFAEKTLVLNMQE